MFITNGTLFTSLSLLILCYCTQIESVNWIFAYLLKNMMVYSSQWDLKECIESQFDVRVLSLILRGAGVCWVCLAGRFWNNVHLSIVDLLFITGLWVIVKIIWNFDWWYHVDVLIVFQFFLCLLKQRQKHFRIEQLFGFMITRNRTFPQICSAM